MGEKRGEKSSRNKWHFPVWKEGFSQAGLLNFQDFFFSRREEGRARPDVEMDGQQWVAQAACCIHSSSTGLQALML